MTTSNDLFPLDWDQWRTQWDAWKQDHADRLGRSTFRFPDKNFLADEILGVWSVNGRNVELSEVTFPNLTERDEHGHLIRRQVRFIGITFGTGAGCDTPDQPVVRSFAQLEHELGLTCPTCDKDTSGSEGWSTGQCDDCYLEAQDV